MRFKAIGPVTTISGTPTNLNLATQIRLHQESSSATGTVFVSGVTTANFGSFRLGPNETAIILKTSDDVIYTDNGGTITATKIDYLG